MLIPLKRAGKEPGMNARGSGRLTVSAHAIERARRLLGCLSDAEAIVVLSSPIIESTARAGATSVILPSGHKVIIANNRVITVKPVSCHKRNKRRKA